ncbi:tRNA-dependent cyclodipeptide synthase [Kibdelosporangium aridum]|uniref:tRNA-dependent cyclodipeptide synthase n=1 Tax=Kibdelosporangium aridum TaxID=2030 RepID=UPI0035F0D045
MDLISKPYDDRSTEIVARGRHAVVGLSPFNGYSSAANIHAIVGWACQHFDQVDVMTAGYEAAYTLAPVMPPHVAAKRVRKAIRQIRSQAGRALADHGVTSAERHVACWTQLLERPAYAELFRWSQQVWHQDSTLRTVCEDVARVVLSGNTTTPTADQVRLAARYAVAELPFFTDSPAIYEVDCSVFIYHRRLPFLDRLLSAQHLALGRSPGQAFLTLSPVLENTQ